MTVLAGPSGEAIGNLADASAHVLARGNDFEVPDVDTGWIAAEMIDVTPLRGPLPVREEPGDASCSRRSSGAINCATDTQATVAVRIATTEPRPAFIGSADIDLRPESLGKWTGGGAFAHAVSLLENYE